MKSTEPFFRPMLLWILFFSFVLFIGVVAAYCLGWFMMENVVSQVFKSDDITAAANAASQRLLILRSRGILFGLPLALILIFFWSFGLWAALRRMMIRKRPESHTSVQRGVPKQTERLDAAGEKIIYRTDKQQAQRLYAHLLTVFQREGRLVDFFSEELGDYQDAQIGATVREIHESCKKALHRHLRIKAVVDLNEGEKLTLEKGFDSRAFHLIGNIRGEPPFKGIVRHHGWKITQWEIPDLAGDLKPEIIAPAEIEVV